MNNNETFVSYTPDIDMFEEYNRVIENKYIAFNRFQALRIIRVIIVITLIYSLINTSICFFIGIRKKTDLMVVLVTNIMVTVVFICLMSIICMIEPELTIFIRLHISMYSCWINYYWIINI